MKTLFGFIFQKTFLFIIISLCLLLLLLRVFFPLLGFERAEFTPIGFSVGPSGKCYLGRGENLYIFEEGVHTDTLTLPRELMGYECFAVLPARILFESDGTIWQSALDLSDLQVCDNQEEALGQLNIKKTEDNNDYYCSVKMLYGHVRKETTKEVLAKTPLHDNIFRSTLILLGLVVFVHGCRAAILTYKIDRNSHRGRHPNWDD